MDAWEADLRVRRDRAPAGAATRRSPWCRCLTVHSGERDESFEGRQRILLNQSDLGALHRELSTVFEPSWANFIVAYRQYGPHTGSEAGTDASSLVRGSDAAAAAQHPVAAGTDRGARGDSHRARRTRRRSSRVPWRTIRVGCATTLPKLMDHVTVRSGAPIAGRVNVNLAAREVLAAIPGFDTALGRADHLRTHAGRRGRPRAMPRRVAARRRGVVDRQQMQRIEPWVTAGGRRRTCSDYRLLRPAQPVHAVRDGR